MDRFRFRVLTAIGIVSSLMIASICVLPWLIWGVVLLIQATGVDTFEIGPNFQVNRHPRGAVVRVAASAYTSRF